MYRFAEYLIETGYAFVDEQSADEMRETRGTLTERRQNSPFRDRPKDESLRLFREMRAGEARRRQHDPARQDRHAVAQHQHARPGDLPHPLRRAPHDRRRVEGLPDVLVCAPDRGRAREDHPLDLHARFEDERPFYDWMLERIVPLLRQAQYEAAARVLEGIRDAGIEAAPFALHCRNVAAERPDKLGASRYERRAETMFASWSKNPDLAASDADEFFKLLLEHTERFTLLLESALDERKANPFLLPHQYEFNRLNLTYVVMSKRKLIQLVEEKHVDGWDDPRMPTIVGLRRRGHTPQSLQLFAERTGVSRFDASVDRLQPARTGAARRPRRARRRAPPRCSSR